MTVMEWLQWKYRGYLEGGQRYLRARLDKLPKADIGNGAGNTFFWRYDLWKAKLGGFAAVRLGLGGLYLHEFLRSDEDRCKHDHPWFFITFVIGGYWEETETGRHWRRSGSLLYRPATFAHRIELEPGRKAWSIVLVGVKSREWGFWTLDGWKQWVKGQASPICETGTAVPVSKPPTITRAPSFPFKPPLGF